eukprot:scaffold2557_cov55-Phaeocystis_antarctica.AAC.1
MVSGAILLYPHPKSPKLSPSLKASPNPSPSSDPNPTPNLNQARSYSTRLATSCSARPPSRKAVEECVTRQNPAKTGYNMVAPHPDSTRGSANAQWVGQRRAFRRRHNPSEGSASSAAARWVRVYN